MCLPSPKTGPYRAERFSQGKNGSSHHLTEHQDCCTGRCALLSSSVRAVYIGSAHCDAMILTSYNLTYGDRSMPSLSKGLPTIWLAAYAWIRYIRISFPFQVLARSLNITEKLSYQCPRSLKSFVLSSSIFVRIFFNHSSGSKFHLYSSSVERSVLPLVLVKLRVCIGRYVYPDRGKICGMSLRVLHP